ncbi:AMP-binding enzyme, partial [Rhizobium leguminosarum]|uniref:AMP-binding enzyme n=1 Tax=Rhizobium leguminosarum TaxID=384 RepID=UPI003F9CE906
ISGGNNVYPAEVESALKACPGVEDAVVFGLPDAYFGQRIVSVFSGETIDPKILTDHPQHAIRIEFAEISDRRSGFRDPEGLTVVAPEISIRN